MPKTKVFLTWSGTKSKQLSQALREWLPQVIQNLEPWMSDSDLDKGSRWASEIAGQLEQAQIGIICLTPENIEKPWINFEAGALSKQLERSRVCPYLLGLSPSDLTFPLAQFHATIADKHETLKMLQSINKTMGESGLPEQALDSSFTMWWPKFKARIDQITQDGECSNTAANHRGHAGGDFERGESRVTLACGCYGGTGNYKGATPR